MYKDKGILLKRARQKYLSVQLSYRLHYDNPTSPLLNSYYGSFLCCSVLTQDGRKLRAKYCNQRWCFVCNRIRTARLISGYLAQIQSFKNPYFVTLTKRTVHGCDLRGNMEFMGAAWRKITDMARRTRKDFKGIRKAECTIRPGDLYHYHYHLVVEGRENAEWLIENWLQRMGDEAQAGGQDMRKANENSLKELFKYFTKLTTKSPEGKKVMFESRRMDVIFQAMKGKRVFQPFGGLKIIKEDIEEIIGEEYEHLEDEFQYWKWVKEDWISEVGECLTNYSPNSDFEKMVESLQYESAI